MYKLLVLAINTENEAEKIDNIIKDVSNPSFWSYINWSIIFKKAAIAIGAFIIGIYILKLINSIIRKILNSHEINKGLIHFLTKFVSFLYLFILITFIAGNLGFKTTSLITLIGSLGIAIGLALQGSLQDLASGILIVTLNYFKVGDYVYIGDNDDILIVDNIKLFNSSFKNASNYIISYPNSYIAKNKITNLSISNDISCSYYFHVPLDVNVSLIKKLAVTVLENEPLILHDKGYVVKIAEITDYSLKFLITGQVKDKDLVICKGHLTESIKEILEKNGIKTPHKKLLIYDYAEKNWYYLRLV